MTPKVRKSKTLAPLRITAPPRSKIGDLFTYAAV
jgi:hypothetical protein